MIIWPKLRQWLYNHNLVFSHSSSRAQTNLKRRSHGPIKPFEMTQSHAIHFNFFMCLLGNQPKKMTRVNLQLYFSFQSGITATLFSMRQFTLVMRLFWFKKRVSRYVLLGVYKPTSYLLYHFCFTNYFQDLRVIWLLFFELYADRRPKDHFLSFFPWLF